ncbi:MAG: S8 family serine peptidase, partial [Bacteroidota bacterium]
IDLSTLPEFNGGSYAWMQFYSTPNQNVQNDIKLKGVILLGYISNSTYLTFIPKHITNQDLSTFGVRGIMPPSNSMKMTSSLSNGDVDNWAIQGNKTLLNVLAYENINIETVISNLQSKSITIKESPKGSNLLTIAINNSDLQTVASLPYIQWVEQISQPGEKEDTRGRSLHRSSNLDTQTGAGRNYTGDGIGVLVRDDGIVGPHIDFQGRIDNSGANTTGQTHGDGVAGIMAGAGNLDPSMRGMAAGSDVYVSNYTSNFLDGVTTSLINAGTVQITNSSYSDGCNGGYTTGTQTVDQQTKTIPTLLHVFSAGNNGTSNCNYGAGGGWGNITGGHKQGKNVIATANVYFDGSLVNSSSRGPAYDGRIKPDIAANGQNQNSTDENNTYMSFGGTSGAAPGIAGISAQLYEAYGDANAGALPQSALIKAALLNTANDYGNVGPDYKYGWGIVNGLRAAKLIEDNRYLSSTIANGATNNHSITVPSGTKQVRFMVYWSDPAATPGVTTCLVNDLDLTVTTTSSATLLPWILDPTPTAAALNTPATNGADHLNNMEQVLINSPAAGTYTININGFNVPMGPQEYFIVYEIIEEKVTVTYPNMGESFVPGETESIHWDAINTTGSFVLEYSTNNGTSWNNIATVSGATTNYEWTVPNTVTGSAKIRVSNGTNIDISDDVFSIAPLVLNQQITQVCPDSAKFTWNAVANAQSYDLYLLGVKYMEVAGTSNTVNITIPIANPFNPMWFAVVAKNNTLGWKSRRTIATFYAGGLLNCSLSNDVE